MNLQRLDKILSSAQNISRADARKLILRSKVTVNGVTVRDIGFKTDGDKEKIEYDGQAVKYKEHIYIIMNKPKGVLSASDDKTRETVVDLVPQELFRQGLFPVGRLDRDTTGLLIITDDGDFAHKVISPKKNINKCYLVTLDGKIEKTAIDLFAKGIVLADGTVCKPAILEILQENMVKVTISEGKYHQIKRMFGTIGLGVEELSRVSIGKLCLPQNLDFGECRELLNDEIRQIFDN